MSLPIVGIKNALLQPLTGTIWLTYCIVLTEYYNTNVRLKCFGGESLSLHILPPRTSHKTKRCR